MKLSAVFVCALLVCAALADTQQNAAVLKGKLRRKGFFGAIAGAALSGAGSALMSMTNQSPTPPPVAAAAPAPAPAAPAAPSAPRPRMPEDVEDCVACRYVWLQVEMDVGNSQIEENIYDSFYQNALEAQKAPIFYPACQTMFDSIDDMIGDYMDGYTVNQMCENSLLCR